MTIKQLARELCKREGLKKQIDIAQLSELLCHLGDICFEDFQEDHMRVWDCLYDLGAKRAQKRKKK